MEGLHEVSSPQFAIEVSYRLCMCIFTEYKYFVTVEFFLKRKG